MTLVGHDSITFRTSVSALKKIHQYIDQCQCIWIIVRPLDLSNPAAGMDSDAIQAGTHRIMTPSESKVWPSALDRLTPSIDPDHILRDVVRSGRYQFTEDNVVMYSEMVTDDDGYICH